MDFWKLMFAIRYPYTREQRLAMKLRIPMTKDLFWECIYKSLLRTDRVALRWLSTTFPQYLHESVAEYERKLREDPEFRKQEEEQWKLLLESVQAAFAEEDVLERIID